MLRDLVKNIRHILSYICQLKKLQEGTYVFLAHFYCSQRPEVIFAKIPQHIDVEFHSNNARAISPI